MTPDEIVELLDQRDLRPKSSGPGKWESRCPAHDDRNPSLSVSAGTDDRVLLHCHAGCELGDVLASLDLDAADLFAQSDNGHQPPFEYIYVDERGEVVMKVARRPGKKFAQARPDGAGGWIWNLQGVERVLYRLPAVLAAVAAGETIYVAEGEKDVHALERAGVVATTNPGGAGKWRPEFSAPLAGAAVVVVADDDEPGIRHADAVAKSLREQGCTVRLVRAAVGKDAHDHLTAGRGVGDFTEIISGDERDGNEAAPSNGHADPASVGAPWPVITATSLPPFPVDALPRDVRRWVVATAEETQTPPDLAAISALGVLSAAALGGATVDCGAWEEELGLYLLPVMETGENKSTVLGKARAPLEEIEREWRANAAEALRERRTDADILKARKSKLTKTAGEAAAIEDRVSAEEELREVATRLEEIGDPATPRLFADDVTPEQLGGLLATHGQLAVLAAEAPLIDNLVGRYSEGKANLHVVVKAYTGESHRIDRKDRMDVLERPLLAITLVVQPHVLSGLIDHQIADSQGLVARFAYALPETRQGHRELDPPRVPADVQAAWAATVQHVATLNPLTQLTQPTSVSSVSTSLNRGSDPPSLSFSPSARRRFNEMRADHEARLSESGDLAPHRGWVNRQRGRVARLAGVLHLAHAADREEPIAEETMQSALRIGEYFMAHSLWALSVPNRLERRALGWLASREEPTVTQRDLQRGPLNSRGSAKEAEQLVQALVARCALRPVRDERRGLGRPPSPTFEINPTLRLTAAAEDELGNGNGWRAIEADPQPGVERPTDEDVRALIEAMS